MDSLEARRVHGHCHLQQVPPGKVDKASPKTKANLKTLLWPGEGTWFCAQMWLATLEGSTLFGNVRTANPSQAVMSRGTVCFTSAELPGRMLAITSVKALTLAAPLSSSLLQTWSLLRHFRSGWSHNSRR